MTVYARSDVMSVTHPVTGETFKRKSKEVKGEVVYKLQFAIDSDPEHEAWLIEVFPDQYARHADKVPPTADEIAALDQRGKEAAAAAHEQARQAIAVFAETRGRVGRAQWRSE